MLLIFDWDGTLIDSTGKITHCVQQAAMQVGLPVLPRTTIKSIIGLGLPEAIQTLYPEADATIREQLRIAYSDIFLSSDQRSGSDLYEGVESGLQQLRHQGHILAVATGKSRRGLNRVLDAFNWQDFFDATRCADETASKPNPLMLYQLLAELNTPVEQALMIGDTSFDLAMAQNAGMRSIGVSYGAHPVEHLTPLQPVSIIDQFSEIHSIIDNL